MYTNPKDSKNFITILSQTELQNAGTRKQPSNEEIEKLPCLIPFAHRLETKCQCLQIVLLLSAYTAWFRMQTLKKKMTGSRDFCRSDQSGSNFVSYIDMKIPQPLSKCEQVKYILARIGKDQGHRKCRVWRRHIHTALSVLYRPAKPMPDFRCWPSQKTSPPKASVGVTLCTAHHILLVTVPTGQPILNSSLPPPSKVN
jgi:hypothetical protein